MLISKHASTSTLSVQLMGRDDLTVDDAETSAQRWRQYIDSYVLVSAKRDPCGAPP